MDDALIQPRAGNQTRQSLEMSSRVALPDTAAACHDATRRFPI